MRKDVLYEENCIIILWQSTNLYDITYLVRQTIYPLFSFTGNSHGLLETANSLYMIYLLYMNEKSGILMK